MPAHKKYATEEEAKAAWRKMRLERGESLETVTKRIETTALAYARRMEWIKKFKADRGCIDCGIKDPVVLDVDHNGPKSNRISQLRSIDSIHAEMQDGKCVIRCRNCHSIKSWCERSNLNYDSKIIQMALPNHKAKRYIAQYKLKRGCKVCGYNTHFAALDCHHIGAKRMTINLITKIAEFEHELLFYPFVVLCGNCHRIHHSERLE